MFPGKKLDQVRQKWQSFLKVAVSKAPWSVAEDALLIQILKERGNKRQWKEIANVLNARSGSEFFRHGKQCRERWNNHLDPSINRGAWTPEEDIKLLQSFIELGKKWAGIAKRIGRRTENAVKNRWSSLLRKCKNEFGGESISEASGDMDDDIIYLKKLAQMALEILTSNQERVMKNEESSDVFLQQEASNKSSDLASTEKLSRKSFERDPALFSKENSLNMEMSSLRQQLNEVVLAQINPESSQNISNQNLFTKPLSPLALNHLSGQLGELMTPQNQGQSPNFEALLQNWQNMQMISGVSPMGQFFSGISPTSKGPVGHQNLPFSQYYQYQSVSNEPQSCTDTKLDSSQPTSPAADNNEIANMDQSIFQNPDATSALLNEVLPMRSSVQNQAQNENSVERMSQLKQKPNLQASQPRSQLSLEQLNAAEMLANRKAFEEFSETRIGSHDLQFAVVDVSSNKIYFLKHVTKDNFEPCVATMRSDSNSMRTSAQPCSIDDLSPQNDNLLNKSFNCLNRDLAGLVITPKPNVEREKGSNFPPTFEFLSSLQEQQSNIAVEKDLFYS